MKCWCWVRAGRPHGSIPSSESGHVSTSLTRNPDLHGEKSHLLSIQWFGLKVTFTKHLSFRVLPLPPNKTTVHRSPGVVKTLLRSDALCTCHVADPTACDAPRVVTMAFNSNNYILTNTTIRHSKLGVKMLTCEMLTITKQRNHICS